jgi:molecular chaperone HtpG
MVTRTNAEDKAKLATGYPPFSLNLEQVQRTVEGMLKLFGRGEIFSEYTVHDYSHVYEMLKGLDWLIPIDTQALMSDADWLMIVLSIYFHDLGLVVTEEEYKHRHTSGFKTFVETTLYAGPSGADYKSKVAKLAPEDADRFLYQEYVRCNHATRIRSWVTGRSVPDLDSVKANIAEIDKLLSSLDPEFRSDPAMVCESHNLDDIDDTSKYKLSKAYGNSDNKTASIQYCAVILRSSDLLQFHNSRAPSTLFRLINPTDPISQREWAKQNGVKRIRRSRGWIGRVMYLQTPRKILSKLRLSSLTNPDISVSPPI